MRKQDAKQEVKLSLVRVHLNKTKGNYYANDRRIKKISRLGQRKPERS
jgi:hypothetical protein